MLKHEKLPSTISTKSDAHFNFAQIQENKHTPWTRLNFTVKRFRFIVGTQSWKRLIIIKCENENGKSNADYIEIGGFFDALISTVANL